MKKFLVIGNPIEHSLSPKLHNYWIKQNNINAEYKKVLLNENEIENIISEIRKEKISGINITIPFKKLVVPYVDELTSLAEQAEAVNTIYKKNDKIVGDNTDIGGFENALKYINFSAKNKVAFILGAGGVALSIILALKRIGIKKIFLSNRTTKEPKDLKKNFSDLEIIEWGESPEFDLIINATSLGLKKDDVIKLDYKNFSKNKLFYDVIYSPSKTNFLTKGEETGNQIENGKMMFIYQAQLSFKKWHNILPQIDDKTIKLLDE
jgi:shikimate dehydrogenase